MVQSQKFRECSERVLSIIGTSPAQFRLQDMSKTPGQGIAPIQVANIGFHASNLSAEVGNRNRNDLKMSQNPGHFAAPRQQHASALTDGLDQEPSKGLSLLFLQFLDLFFQAIQPFHDGVELFFGRRLASNGKALVDFHL